MRHVLYFKDSFKMQGEDKTGHYIRLVSILKRMYTMVKSAVKSLGIKNVRFSSY